MEIDSLPAETPKHDANAFSGSIFLAATYRALPHQVRGSLGASWCYFEILLGLDPVYRAPSWITVHNPFAVLSICLSWICLSVSELLEIRRLLYKQSFRRRVNLIALCLRTWLSRNVPRIFRVSFGDHVQGIPSQFRLDEETRTPPRCVTSRVFVHLYSHPSTIREAYLGTMVCMPLSLPNPVTVL